MIIPAAPKVNAVEMEGVRKKAAPLMNSGNSNYRKFNPAEQAAVLLKTGFKSPRYRAPK